METADFLVRDEGSVLVFTPVTESAKEFVTENVEIPGWAWMGNSFVADHRPGQDLLSALIAEGFTVA